jgi:hypothetical protein
MNLEDLKGKWSVSDNVNYLDWCVRSRVVTSQLTCLFFLSLATLFVL